jgi:hypothetical protein
MKILKAEVDWMKGWGNHPRLKVLVDRMPDHETLTYEKRGCLYFAEKEGYVSFYAYDKPGDGYGGSIFPITLNTGEKVDLIGPWSSRPGVMNSHGFTPCVDVSITDEPKMFEGKGCFCAGHITLELAEKAAEMAGCFLVKEDDGEVNWYPSVDPNEVLKPE